MHSAAAERQGVGGSCQPSCMSDLSRRAVIRHVSGRDSKGGERGLPKVSSIEIEHTDGRVLSAGVLPNGPPVRHGLAQAVAAIDPGQFESCPICLVNAADSREHVPTRAFGGQVMTWTCGRCNNTFGSRTESSLQDWYDNSARVHYTRAGDRRPFGRGRAHLLPTPDGEFVLLPERGSDPGETVGHSLRAGEELTMHVKPPVPEEVRIGLLKCAYLAACLHLGGVPKVRSANEIREELLAVVTAARRADVVAGPRAAALLVFRTGAPPSGPPLALMHTEEQGVGHLISLAGTVLVSWPFVELDPATTSCVQPEGR